MAGGCWLSAGFVPRYLKYCFSVMGPICSGGAGWTRSEPASSEWACWFRFGDWSFHSRPLHYYWNFLGRRSIGCFSDLHLNHAYGLIYLDGSKPCLRWIPFLSRKSRLERIRRRSWPCLPSSYQSSTQSCLCAPPFLSDSRSCRLWPTSGSFLNSSTCSLKGSCPDVALRDCLSWTC